MQELRDKTEGNKLHKRPRVVRNSGWVGQRQDNEVISALQVKNEGKPDDAAKNQNGAVFSVIQKHIGQCEKECDDGELNEYFVHRIKIDFHAGSFAF